MNTPPPDFPEPRRCDDAARTDFADLLRRVPLRPPPAEWRAEILETAASGDSGNVAVPFAASARQRSPLRFTRLLTGSLAALWMLSLGMWLETRRLAPASSSSAPAAGAVAAFAPGSLQNEQFRQLLASLESRSAARSASLAHSHP